MTTSLVDKLSFRSLRERAVSITCPQKKLEPKTKRFVSGDFMRFGRKCSTDKRGEAEMEKLAETKPQYKTTSCRVKNWVSVAEME